MSSGPPKLFVHFQKLSEIFHIFLRENLPSNVSLSEPFGQHELKIVLPSLPLKSIRQVEIRNIRKVSINVWLFLESLRPSTHLAIFIGILTLEAAIFSYIPCSILYEWWLFFLSILQVFGSWSRSSSIRFQCLVMFFFCLSWSSSCLVSSVCSYGKGSLEIDALPPSQKTQPSSPGKAHCWAGMTYQSVAVFTSEA